MLHNTIRLRLQLSTKMSEVAQMRAKELCFGLREDGPFSDVPAFNLGGFRLSIFKFLSVARTLETCSTNLFAQICQTQL